MKRHLIIFTFLVLSNISFSQESEFQKLYSWMQNQIVEKHLIDLDFDNKSDTIICKGLVNYDNGKLNITDPGVFMKFIINFADGKHFELFEYFDSIRTFQFSNVKNEIDSKLFSIIKFNNSYYMFVNQPSYGCCASIFWIVQTNKDGVSKQSLDFRPEEIADIDSDNKLDLIGYKNDRYNLVTLTQFELISYSPYKIYTQLDTFCVNRTISDKMNAQLIKRFGEFPEKERYYMVINPDNDTLVLDYETAKHKYSRLYPDLSIKKLKKHSVSWREKEELRLMRNEIFAAYGYIFSSPDLMEHFESTEWYVPISKNVNDKLSEIEKHNINLIREHEKK